MKKLLLTSIALVALVALIVGALPASAEDPTTVAQITGQSTKPGVKAKWELAGTGMTLASPKPYFTTPTFTPSPAASPTSSTNEVCVWAIITDTMGINNISGAFIDVFEPPTYGSTTPTKFKLELYLSNVIDLVALRAAMAAGVASGQLTAAQQADIDDEILKYEALAFRGCWNYDVHQFAGPYDIVANGVNKQGTTGSFTNRINIVSIVALALDFTNVDYGTILPGVKKFVSGDENFGTAGAPTVWNKGNDPGNLNIVSAPMTGVSFGKQIVNFDVMLSSLDRNPKEYLANTVVTPTGKLQPCSPTQIDFSITAPATAPNDIYRGLMTVTIVHAP